MATEKRERQRANREAKQLVEEQASKAEAIGSRFRLAAVILPIVILLVGGYWLLNQGGDDDDTTATANGTVSYPQLDPGAELAEGWSCPATDGTAERTTRMLGEPPSCLDAGASYSAVVTFTDGRAITITLDPENAPNAVNAFVILSRYRYYENTGVFSSDTGLGSFTAGAPNTQEANDPGPSFPIIADDTDDPISAGAVILNANGTFDLVADNADPGYVDARGTVIGRMTPDSETVADAILGLHVDNGSTLAEGDGAPGEAVTIASIDINQS